MMFLPSLVDEARAIYAAAKQRPASKRHHTPGARLRLAHRRRRHLIAWRHRITAWIGAAALAFMLSNVDWRLPW